jgi:hypothetical protein
MAGVPVTISGVLYDKTARAQRPVVIMGVLSRSDLEIGGGPIFPEAPGEPVFPAHPIVLPPEISGPPGPWPQPPIHIPPEKPPTLPNAPDPGDPPVALPAPPGSAGWPVAMVVPPPFIIVNYPGVGPLVVAPPAAATPPETPTDPNAPVATPYKR